MAAIEQFSPKADSQDTITLRTRAVHAILINMTSSNRIGALDIAEAISERIGSYVDMNFIQFLAVERDRIRCWYMNAGGDGPSIEIEMIRSGQEWTLNLTEHPPGTEQEEEVP